MVKISLTIRVNDVLHELVHENKRLLNELLVSNKCLIKLKTHLTAIYERFETNITPEDRQVLSDVQQELDAVDHRSSDDRMDGECSDGRRDAEDALKSTPINGSQLGSRRRQQTQRFGDFCNEDSDEEYVKRKPLLAANKSGKSLTENIGDDYSDCNKVAKQVKKMRRKVKRVYTLDTNIRPFKCDYNGCEYKSKTKGILKTHMRVHVNNPDKVVVIPPNYSYLRQCYDLRTNSYICPEIGCQKSLANYDGIKIHTRDVHSTRSFACDYPECHKSYKSRQLLGLHKMLHNPSKRFKCPHSDCGYETAVRSNLKPHIQSRHSSERSYACPVDGCPKAFKCSRTLLAHSVVHKSEATIRCTVDGCAQLFRRYSQMTRHRVVVHNFAPYVRPNPKRRIKYACEWPGCDYKGTTDRLKLHKLTHTGEKPCACDWPECGKRFATPKCLRDHKNIHYNRKPYACHWPGCAYRCSNSGNIHKHYKQVHIK